jgi:hypothetical protein
VSRKRCERWLQIEVFKRFIRRFPDIEMMLQWAYVCDHSRSVNLIFEWAHAPVYAVHSADNASACCRTFCTAASCKSGG